MENSQITYDATELETIVQILRECSQPEEILLFGALAGATPFSRVAAYDLLVITPNPAPSDWDNIRSYLKLRLPARTRTIPGINLYLCSPEEVNLRMSLFYRFVRLDCKPLYSRTTFKISNKKYDYEKLRTEASGLAQLFRTQAQAFLRTAEQSAADSLPRLAAFHTAYAAEMLLQQLYAAYHATYCDQNKLTTLFLHLRTLSPDLLILLDPERTSASRMLLRLDIFRTKTIYRNDYIPDDTEVDDYLDRTRKMKRIIDRLTLERIEIYTEKK